MRRKVEERKQQAEDAELAPQMPKQLIADHERIIAGILRPRESVLQALKRLRATAPARSAKRKQSKHGDEQVCDLPMSIPVITSLLTRWHGSRSSVMNLAQARCILPTDYVLILLALHVVAERLAIPQACLCCAL